MDDVFNLACGVCFESYDRVHKRPFSIPCGHTFCSICILKNSEQCKFVCPTCRKAHRMTSNEGFQVNCDVESLIPDENSGQTDIVAAILETWEEDYQQQRNAFQDITEQYDDLIGVIGNELTTTTTKFSEVHSQIKEIKKASENCTDVIAAESWIEYNMKDCFPNCEPVLPSGKITDANEAVEQVLAGNPIYTVQLIGEEPSYAKITFDREGELCLHSYRGARELPCDMVTVCMHAALINDDIPELAFIDLGAKGRHLGRLRIRLIQDSQFSRIFCMLCTGVKGVSYVNGSLLQLYNRDCFGELMTLKCYDKHTRSRMKVVVPEVDWKGERERDVHQGRACNAGALSVLSDWQGDVSQFCILTRDIPGHVFQFSFGIVMEGLDILSNTIMEYPNMEAVTITDCGIILPFERLFGNN